MGGVYGSIFDHERVLALKPIQRVQHFMFPLLVTKDVVDASQAAEGKFLFFNFRLGLSGNHQSTHKDRRGFGKVKPSLQHVA